MHDAGAVTCRAQGQQHAWEAISMCTAMIRTGSVLGASELCCGLCCPVQPQSDSGARNTQELTTVHSSAYCWCIH
jgi:hypothetical protein